MMRAMLDSRVWTDLRESDALLEHFGRIYDGWDVTIVFSIGNFLDLVRRENVEGLPSVIAEFVDEYLAALQLDLQGEYRYSSNPLILSTIDAEWYEHCKHATEGLGEVETLRTLFRDADFDDGPVFSRVSELVDEYRKLEARESGDELTPSGTAVQGASLKKVRTFPEYVARDDDGTLTLEEANIPLKRFITGMSMIYVSETRQDPEAADYRDAVTWTQAILSGCDLLWTEREWAPDHPLIEQVVERLDRDYLEFVGDVAEFETAVSE